MIAELIASEKPVDKAGQQVNQVVAQLTSKGLTARGLVTVDEVARGIVKAAVDENVDILFAGTVGKPGHMRIFASDPIVNFLVENCPTSLCLVRQDEIASSEDDEA